MTVFKKNDAVPERKWMLAYTFLMDIVGICSALKVLFDNVSYILVFEPSFFVFYYFLLNCNFRESSRKIR